MAYTTDDIKAAAYTTSDIEAAANELLPKGWCVVGRAQLTRNFDAIEFYVAPIKNANRWRLVSISNKVIRRASLTPEMLCEVLGATINVAIESEAD